jgi:hypothetical protein
LMHHLLCAQRSPSRPQDSYSVLSGFPAGRTSTSHGAADWRSCPAPFPGDQQPGGSGERRFGSAPAVANGCAWHICSKSYSRNERNTELCANCNEASLVVNGFDYITLPVAHALVSHTAHTQEEAAEAATAGGDGQRADVNAPDWPSCSFYWKEQKVQRWSIGVLNCNWPLRVIGWANIRVFSERSGE